MSASCDGLPRSVPPGPLEWSHSCRAAERPRRRDQNKWRIYERLRVGRHAVEMMKLDDLSTYLLSDGREDPDLVKLLSDCGCGHLFAMAGQMPFNVPALMRQARDWRPEAARSAGRGSQRGDVAHRDAGFRPRRYRRLPRDGGFLSVGAARLASASLAWECCGGDLPTRLVTRG
jgi:hypothetical protein